MTLDDRESRRAIRNSRILPDDSPRGRFARTYHAAREARPPCTNDDRFAG